MAGKLSKLDALIPEEIQDIIDDLELQQKGASIYYALDPHELFDFCFPVNPSNLGQVYDINAIADDQAALYEIFYVRQEKPLILPDYVRELRGLLSYFNHEAENVYDKAEILQRLLQAGHLESIVSESETELNRVIEQHFNVILAFVMGLYQIGVDRFKDIFYKGRLVRSIESDIDLDGKVIQSIVAGYKQTKLSKTVFDEIQRWQAEWPADALVQQRRRRNNIDDSRAIDRVIYLNRAFAEAARTGRLKREYLVLYLSAAKRTRRIFEDIPAVFDAVGNIGRGNHKLYRTRSHIFAYVVHKTRHGTGSVALEETIRNLKQTQEIKRELQKLEEDPTSSAFECENCILEVSQPSGMLWEDCRLIPFCKRIKSLSEMMIATRAEVRNLGLVTKSTDYETLLQAHREPSYSDYYDLFKRILKSKLKDIAMIKMKEKQDWILIRTVSANLLKDGVSSSLKSARTVSFRRSKDRVTGIDQYLPTKPRLKSERYGDILLCIFGFYRDPSRIDLIDKAFDGFMTTDSPKDSIDLDEEIVRCYLYLAFGRGEDEEKPYELARSLLTEIQSMAASSDIERELMYLICWASRRIGRFSEADQYANTGITKWSEDARFYHGRCLNTYAWLSDLDAHSSCPNTVDSAITDAKTAITLYSEDDSSANKDVIAANFNNLAFFFAWQVTLESYGKDEIEAKLNEGRRALERLKALVPKEEWKPNHPEFFHTEAFLEYQEFTAGFSTGLSRMHLIEKLTNARREIETAIALYDEGPGYRNLFDRIVRGQAMLQARR